MKYNFTLKIQRKYTARGHVCDNDKIKLYSDIKYYEPAIGRVDGGYIFVSGLFSTHVTAEKNAPEH